MTKGRGAHHFTLELAETLSLVSCMRISPHALSLISQHFQAVSGPSGKKAKKGSAIDDIFASTKTVKAATAVEEEVRIVTGSGMTQLVKRAPPFN
jgi:hypothetical protein